MSRLAGPALAVVSMQVLAQGAANYPSRPLRIRSEVEKWAKTLKAAGNKGG